MGFVDCYVERRIRKNIFFKQINTLIDLKEINDVSAHSVLSRFRTELTEKKSFDRLLKEINCQLVTHKVIVCNGAGIEDTTLTDTLGCTKDKKEYELAEYHKEDQRPAEACEKEEVQMNLVRKQHPGVDNEARYLKKGEALHYGYKRHVLTDENGIQLSVHTTCVNQHDNF